MRTGTGGAVCLGLDPIAPLLAAGHEMHCVGNLFTDTKRNIEHLHQEPPFEFMLRDFPPYVEVDEIYNRWQGGFELHRAGIESDRGLW